MTIQSLYIYIGLHVHYFSFVIPKYQGQGPANVLLMVPPLKIPSLPCSLAPTLLCSIPCSSPFIHCSLPSSLYSSSVRYLPPLFPSLRPCLVTSVYCSFPSSTLPSSTPAPFLPNIIASSHPPLAPSLPPSILPRSFPAPSLPAGMPPSNSMYAVCVFGKLSTVLCSA